MSGRGVKAAAIGAGVALGLLLVWFLITGLLAANSARQVEANIRALNAAVRARDGMALTTALTNMQTNSAELDARLNGVPWSMAASLPVVGSSVATAAVIASGTHAGSDAVLEQGVDLSGVLLDLQKGGSSGLRALERIAVVTQAAVDAVEPALTELSSIPPSELPVVGGLLAERRERFLSTTAGLNTANAAAHALPDLLGASGERRWMVMLQNTAEARGTGGLIGAYATVDVAEARFHPVGAATTNALAGKPVSLEGIPRDTRQLWGASLPYLGGWNLDRHFPFAGLLASRGLADAGNPVDDVISLDARAVAALMRLTGPVTAAGVTINAENAADFFTRRIYQQFPDPDRKDQVAVALTTAMMLNLAGDPLDPGRLWQTLNSVAAQGRILTFSTHDDTQEWLSQLPTGGIVPTDPGPWATVAINDFAGSKKAPYLFASFDYASAASCGAVSELDVRLRNEAPRGLPPYVDKRADEQGGPPGSMLYGVAVYGPVGAALREAEIDGEAVRLSGGTDRQHPVWYTTIEVLRDETITLRVHFQEPQSVFEPVFVAQPLTRDAPVSVTRRCG